MRGASCNHGLSIVVHWSKEAMAAPRQMPDLAAWRPLARSESASCTGSSGRQWGQVLSSDTVSGRLLPWHAH